MKILLILSFIPLDKGSGGGQAIVNMLDYLRKHCELTITFPVRHHTLKDVEALQQKWPDVNLRPYKYWEDKHQEVPFSYNPRFLRWKRKMDKARTHMIESFFAHRPYSDDPAEIIRDSSMLMLDESVNNTPVPFMYFANKIAKEGFDIVQTEFLDYITLPYFLDKSIHKVFVHHELRYIRLENEVSLFPDKRITDRALLRYNKDKEIAALLRYNDIIVLTEHDKEELSQYIPAERIHCSPAAIPTDRQYDFKACGNHFVFVGSSTHYPNLDGFLWFTKEVIPELRKRMTNFTVSVVGAWDKKYAKLLSKEYHELKFEGFVDDLGSFLNGKITIVPIRIGSGMRMKIIDAINSKSPFITTTKGVEGQDFADSEQCLIRDDAWEFAQAMEALSMDQQMQQKLSESASDKLKSKYNYNEMLERRLEVYKEILNPSSK